MMEVIVTDDGSVIVGLKPLLQGQFPQPTRTLEKHGLILLWDGRGTLTGVHFLPNGEPPTVRVPTKETI
jgi:hypothetical protein